MTRSFTWNLFAAIFRSNTNGTGVVIAGTSIVATTTLDCSFVIVACIHCIACKGSDRAIGSIGAILGARHTTGRIVSRNIATSFANVTSSRLSTIARTQFYCSIRVTRSWPNEPVTTVPAVSVTCKNSTSIARLSGNQTLSRITSIFFAHASSLSPITRAIKNSTVSRCSIVLTNGFSTAVL